MSDNGAARAHSRDSSAPPEPVQATLGILAVVPAIVVPVVATRGQAAGTAATVTTGCPNPNNPKL